MSILRTSAIHVASSLLALGVVFPTVLDAQDQMPSHNCDMAAVITHTKVLQNCLIAEMPDIPGDFNDPQDFFYDFISDRSTLATNDDGYRVVFYPDGEMRLPIDQVTAPYPYWSPECAQLNSAPLNSARRAIMDVENEAVIVLAHARNGTGGEGNHPFTFSGEGRTWTFMHNGGILDEGNTPDIKHALWYDLYRNTGDNNGSWFAAHPSNWVSADAVWDYTRFIDSELLFHWIMKNILAQEGDVLAGLHAALTAQLQNPIDGTINLYYQFMQNYATANRINFVLCDGEALFVFRNTLWDDTGNWRYELSYEVFDVEGGFVAVKTQSPLANRLPQFTLAYLPRLGSPVEFSNFHLGYTTPRIVPTNYPTIQQAIDASSNGDVVLVRPGIYNENIDFGGRAITVRSDGDGDPLTLDLARDGTIIDGGQLDTTVTFQSGETRLSRLEGLTIRNGMDLTGAYKFGGGIWCWGFGGPTLIHNLIINNRAKYGGGISCLDDASPLIAWNTIRDNISDSSGGGLHLDRSLSTITHNEIKANVGGAVYASAQGGGLGFNECDLRIINNLIVGNFNFFGHGGAISSNASNVVMTNNTVSENQDGGQTCDGIYLYNQSTLSVYNCILYGNGINPTYEVVLGGAGSSAFFAYSDLEGGLGGVFSDPGSFVGWDQHSMIDEDPLFRGGGDFRLTVCSPCIDTGWNRAPHVPDLDLGGDPRIQDGPDCGLPQPCILFGGRVDMGAYEFPGFVGNISLK